LLQRKAENNDMILFIHRAFCAILLAVVLLTLPHQPVLAQETGAAAEAPAEASAADAAAEAPAEEEPAGPEVPERLTQPGIPLEELSLRVIPLTSDELAALAAVWLDIVKLQTEAVIDRQVSLLTLEGEAAEEARIRLADQTEIRGEAFARLTAIVNHLEAKGGDPAVVAQYRAYRNSIIVEEKQQADWRTLLRQAINWTTSPDGGIALAIQIGIFLATLLGLLIVARIIRRIARRMFGRVPNLSKLLQAFLAMVVYWLTIAIGLMVVLSGLGVNVTPMFALLGGASFIAAFAFQDTLGNLAAGLMIMINHPFDEGDYVTVAGVGGTVKSVSVVSTTVVTPDNQVIVIPNSKVWGDIITNVTASTTRRVDLVFGIGYDDSIEAAQKVLEETVFGHPLVLSDPAPVIRVNELADSSVNFVVRPWARSADYWTVYWDLTRQVKTNFDAAGISIPFPQSDLHLRLPAGMSGAALAAPASAAAKADKTGRPAGAPDYATGDEGFDDDAGGEARNDG
jgi:small conductance mechanosensitive channel